MKAPKLDSNALEGSKIETQFQALAQQWHDGTGHMSSAISITQHPAYLRIISMVPSS